MVLYYLCNKLSPIPDPKQGDQQVYTETEMSGGLPQEDYMDMNKFQRTLNPPKPNGQLIISPVLWETFTFYVFL